MYALRGPWHLSLRLLLYYIDGKSDLQVERVAHKDNDGGGSGLDDVDDKVVMLMVMMAAMIMIG